MKAEVWGAGSLFVLVAAVLGEGSSRREIFSFLAALPGELAIVGLYRRSVLGVRVGKH